MLALYDYDDIMESHDNEVWSEGRKEVRSESTGYKECDEIA